RTSIASIPVAAAVEPARRVGVSVATMSVWQSLRLPAARGPKEGIDQPGLRRRIASQGLCPGRKNLLDVRSGDVHPPGRRCAKLEVAQSAARSGNLRRDPRQVMELNELSSGLDSVEVAHEPGEAGRQCPLRQMSVVNVPHTGRLPKGEFEGGV